MPALSPAANAGTVRIVVAKMPKNRVCRVIFRLRFICVHKYPRVCRMSGRLQTPRVKPLHACFRRKTILTMLFFCTEGQHGTGLFCVLENLTMLPHFSGGWSTA